MGGNKLSKIRQATNKDCLSLLVHSIALFQDFGLGLFEHNLPTNIMTTVDLE